MLSGWKLGVHVSAAYHLIIIWLVISAVGPDGQPRAKRPRADGGSRRGERKRARRERRERAREEGLVYSSPEEEAETTETRERVPREPEYDRKGRKYKTKAIISDSDSSSSSDDEDGSGKSPDKEGDKSDNEGKAVG